MSTLDYAFFYNSVGKDREYSANSFEHWLKKFFTTGVFADELQVKESSGMTITLTAGYCNINGKVRFFEKDQYFNILSAHPTLDRMDAVVLERNDPDRNIIAKVVTGGASIKPDIIMPIKENPAHEGVHQIVVAKILVKAGATSISQADITDTRTDTELCGYVASTVKEMDFGQFSAQFRAYYENFKNGNEADFDTWFNKIKNQLSTDAAGNLQNQINALNSSITELDSIARVKVETSKWSASATQISGKLYFKAEINLSKITDSVPEINITGDTGIIPTQEQQEAYNCIKYAGVDKGTNTINLYAEEKPSAAFSIIIKGAKA
nr:MAG TPA: Receptor Binding Protein [Caudoviricetes sp.]